MKNTHILDDWTVFDTPDCEKCLHTNKKQRKRNKLNGNMIASRYRKVLVFNEFEMKGNKIPNHR